MFCFRVSPGFCQDYLPQVNIVPAVANIKGSPGSFKFNKQTVIRTDRANKGVAGILTDYLSAVIKIQNRVVINRPTNKLRSANTIIISAEGAENLPAEGYKIEVTPSTITIIGKGAGALYGVQTLIQLIPPGSKEVFSIPCVSIRDYPRFGYRGMMLDVARHFYPVSFIKKYIDYLVMHKLNTLHLHLTDDHGWRIEIKKYPKLTQISSWRKGTQLTMNPFLIDSIPHGGFYTQNDIRDIVKYAASRYVTVVPEIEMPGHTLEVLAAYPELSCSGGPFEMPLQWQQTKDIFCAGNEQTFSFLEDVLCEVADLFPSGLIHIGGDEAPKDRWKVCPKCQLRIKEEGLQNEHELQSYFTKRIEKFLVTKNKRIIGWDEILEGGLAPEATVMSYRGVKAGIEAAKQHHDVIMTPSPFLYFDYYQGDPTVEPQSIGNFLPLGKVYSYEPVPKELAPEEVKYIKGVQANLWTEFVPNPESAEYMTIPRLAALAEVAWTQPELKSWDNFMRRMETHYQRYAELGINYAKSSSFVNQNMIIDTIKKEALIDFKTERYHPDIYYTLDGTSPTQRSLKYTAPFTAKSGTIKASVIENGRPVGKESIKHYVIHAANYKKVQVDTISKWVENYLTNGVKAASDYRDKEWFKFKERDLNVVLDLGKLTEISQISTSFFQHADHFIFLPENVQFTVSVDGVEFTTVGLVRSATRYHEKGLFIKDFQSGRINSSARFIKVTAKNVGLSPNSHYAPGQKAWLYLDEIRVN